MEIKQKYLEGLKFSYKGVNISINKVKRVGNNIVIITDKKTYNLTESEAEEFEALLEKPMTEKTISINTDKMNVNDVLIESINKVRTDKEYIQQANAICNIVSQMINIKKLEIQLKK